MTSFPTQIAALEAAIAYHRDRYYQEDAPEISDAEYDALVRQLAEHAPHAPILKTLGGSPSLDGEKVPHVRPLLSLANAFSADEVRHFLDRLPPHAPVYLEYKIDGLTVVLTYVHGQLTHAATRGNGLVGENVWANVQAIPDIPQQLHGTVPETVTVRGEVFMRQSVFAELNAEGTQVWANPRNAAAGALRTKDPEITRMRRLSCWAYDIVAASDGIPRTQTAMMVDLRAWGFAVEPHGTGAPAETAIAHAEALYAARARLDFAIDGIVLKADDPAVRTALGSTRVDPKWAMAYKFPAPRQTTRLCAVTWQVGRTGRLTPVGALDPVALAGSTIQRVTLHNADFIQALDLHLGDGVLLEKAGEVIPAVIGVVRAERPADARPIVFPTACPECGAPVTADRCTGTACPAQQFSSLFYFVRPDVMHIDGLGPTLVEKLIAAGRLTTVADYFDLTVADLAALPSVGARTAEKIAARIHAAKARGLEAFLVGLNIPLANHGTAQRIAAHYPDLDAFLAVIDRPDALEQLQQIADIGPKVAESLRTHLRSPAIRSVIARCQAAGVSMVSTRYTVADAPAERGPLTGTSWVMTGVLSVPRRAMATLLQEAGATVGDRVSSHTHYVLLGDRPGSKAQQAEALGVPCVDEATVRRWIARGQIT